MILKTALVPIVGKSTFASPTKHSESNKHRSTSFMRDNM